MKSYAITIDLHKSGIGFSVSIEGPSFQAEYPKPIKDISDALSHAFELKDAVERETGYKIQEKDLCVTQRALEYNAMTTPDNMTAYRSIMSGKIKPQGRKL